MEAINRVDNNLTKDEEDIYDKVRDLVKEMRRVWDGIKADPVNGPAFFEQVKALTVLVDQKELMEKQLTNLDTPIFDMTRTIDELDHPLAHYAERMKHWILRGEPFLLFLTQDPTSTTWPSRTSTPSCTSRSARPN